jgi:hypothetical protein
VVEDKLAVFPQNESRLLASSRSPNTQDIQISLVGFKFAGKLNSLKSLKVNLKSKNLNKY